MNGTVPLGQFFLPGPVEVHPEVLQALLHPMFQHRGPEMTALFARVQDPLRALFRTARPVILSTSSATGLMEAAILNGVRRRALAVVGGYFGERFALVGESCGREVDRLDVAEGEVVAPARLAEAIDRLRPDAVLMVHCETGTGALAPLEELAAVVRRFDDVMLLVDGVTSVGGSPVETDAWGVDFVFTGSQKALGLPPGLAFAAASERMLERARSIPARGWYFDLVRHHEAAVHHAPTQTPAISLVCALDVQLARIAAAGGVEARWARHRTLREVVESWAADRPEVRFLAAPGDRAWTLSALRLDDRLDAVAVQQAMRAEGFVIGTGLDRWRHRLLRIGHMGDVEPANLGRMLEVLAHVLRRGP